MSPDRPDPGEDSPVVHGDLVPSDLSEEAGDDDEALGGLDLGELLGGDGAIDMGALLEQASQMQQQMAEAQEQAAAVEVEGVSGGGAVRITVTGGGMFRTVRIDPSAVDPDDVEMLEDLVLAALTDAGERVAALQSEALGPLGGGLDGPLG